MARNNEITFNKVYTRLAETLEMNFENISVCSERISEPATLPAVWIVEIDTHPEMKYTALDFTDNQRRSTIEVQVFSNLLGGGTLQAEEIMNVAANELRSMGYLMRSNMPVDNIDSNIKRRIAMFSRIIGGGDSLNKRVLDMAGEMEKY